MVTKKKKEQTWDEIGESIGRKIEKEFKGKDFKGKCCEPWWKEHTVLREEGGGFGRLLFIIGILLALSTMGLLPQLPWWNYAIIVVGFMLMRF
ncbi:hypothetical protein ACFLQ2_03275 [archaeon]